MMKKMISVFLALLLCVCLAVSVFAAEDTGFLYDEANLLTDGEEAALTNKLAAISGEYNAQIVIVTIEALDADTVDYYVDYLYDSMGFGYGQNHDGVLLMVCMDPREFRILSNGYAGVAIDDGDIDLICDEIVGNLSAGDYAGAFHEFADECAYYLDGYVNGYPFDFSGNLATCLIIGVVVGLIVVLILRGQLKTVRRQHQANVYVKQGSMHVNVMNDFFLYRNVTRTKKQSSSSSGSGGSSRSRGGGSF